MVERRQHLCFALESHEPIRVGRKDFGKALDGDVAIQPGVARPVDFAHAARAERRPDFVDSDSRPGGQLHESRLILALSQKVPADSAHPGDAGYSESFTEEHTMGMI